MSYYLIDFTSKNNDFNFDNLIIGRKIKMDQENCKYYIYYQIDSSDTPKEIYIRLPILRLIYNISNYKYNQLSIPIYPNWDGTNKFIDFIKILEQDINECFIKKNIKKEWVSIINKKNTLNFIKASLNDNIKITSNLQNQKISINDFKINGQIDVVIKMSLIWCKNSKMGLSSQIYQIKYIAPPEQLNINFIDTELPKTSSSILPKDIPLLNSIVPVNKQEENNELPPQLKIKMIPSIKDLQKAIKDLKPVSNNVES